MFWKWYMKLQKYENRSLGGGGCLLGSLNPEAWKVKCPMGSLLSFAFRSNQPPKIDRPSTFCLVPLKIGIMGACMPSQKIGFWKVIKPINCSDLPRFLRNGNRWPITLENIWTLITFLGSVLFYCHYWSQICGNMGPYKQNNWGLS